MVSPSDTWPTAPSRHLRAVSPPFLPELMHPKFPDAHPMKGSPVALVFTTRRGDPRLPRRLPPWPARLCRSPISFRQAWVFGSPLLGLPFLSLPGLARTLRRVACEICRAAAAVRSPAPPALLTGDLVSDGPSGIFVYVSSYVSTAAFGWALDSLAGSRFFA